MEATETPQNIFKRDSYAIAGVEKPLIARFPITEKVKIKLGLEVKDTKA